MRNYTLLLVFFLQILSVGMPGVYFRSFLRMILLHRILKPLFVENLAAQVVHVLPLWLNGQQNDEESNIRISRARKTNSLPFFP